MQLQRIIFINLVLCLCTYANAQQTGTDSMTVPGGKFTNTKARIRWMGANYRQEWNTPVKVPVMKLTGLVPIKRGGGKQTKSLRMQDASGKQYTIRSIQKFITSKTLPGDLNSQAAADLVADGVSASYPYASLSMQPLADAVGVPYGKVRLVYIGDDAALGEFRSEFSNMLATFEERMPQGINKIYDTDEVAEKLEKDNDNMADQKALLIARILDMYVMDLDRHEDQWQWGAKENEKGGKTFFPIPRDRDQAFYINRGVLPGIVKKKAFVPQLEGFKAKAKSISRFNFAARNLDRFFLNGLTESQWKSTVEEFLQKMTDEVIEKAMAMQPVEIRALPSNQMIINTLKERRKYLAEEVMEYYMFLSDVVTITGSDKKDLFQVTRNADGSSLVQVFKIQNDGNKGPLMFERLFDSQVTKEIILYGFDGNDKFEINGKEDKIKIFMIGGGGADLFQNTAKRGRNSAYVFDKNIPENILSGKFYNKMSNDSDVNKFNRLWYKYKYNTPGIALGFNPDDGVFLGLTQKIITHGFRKEPHKAAHFFSVSHALSTKAWNFSYNNEFINAFGKNVDLLTNIDVKAPNNTTNFFGYGMNTVYDKNQPEKFRYYRARYNLADISLLMRERFTPNFTLSFGPVFQRFKMDSADKNNAARFITDISANGLDPATAFSTSMFFGGKLQMSLDLRDNKVLPSKGLNWETNVRHLSGLKDNPYAVTQLNSDFSFYVKLGKDNRFVWANRFGGGTNIGNKGFEFYQAQYLGSEDNLRGFRRHRFAGKSKLYNQTELRLKLADFTTYLFPGAIGIFTFLDAGKVWVKNDPGNTKLAYGYGGGVWFSPLRRIMLTVTYAMSKEDKLPIITLGWRF
jgi:hypothetical protein